MSDSLLSIDDYLVAKNKNKCLYQDEDGQYFFVEEITEEEANEWLNTQFDTITLDMKDEDIQALVGMAEKLNMSLDSLVTVLLEKTLD